MASHRSEISLVGGRSPSRCQILLARGHVMKRWLESSGSLAHRGHISESIYMLVCKVDPGVEAVFEE